MMYKGLSPPPPYKLHKRERGKSNYGWQELTSTTRMNHCALPPLGPQHIESRRCPNLMRPLQALYCRQVILTER